MRNLVNPQQIRLFDPFDSVLTPQTRKHLLDGWPGVFRHVLLEKMPVEALSEHLDPVMGRPSKEIWGYILNSSCPYILRFSDFGCRSCLTSCP